MLAAASAGTKSWPCTCKGQPVYTLYQTQEARGHDVLYACPYITTCAKAVAWLEWPISAPAVMMSCQFACACTDLSCTTKMTVVGCSPDGCGASLRHATSSQLDYSPAGMEQCMGDIGGCIAQALAQYMQAHHSETATSWEPLALQRTVCGCIYWVTMLTPALSV